MRRGALLLLGVIAFAGFAVAKAPAHHLYGWLAPQDAMPRAAGISGTLTRGSVGQLQINTRGSPIGDLNWNLQTWKLMLARASYHVQGGDEGLLVDGVAAALPLGTVLVQDFRLSAPLTRLAAITGYTFVPATATIGMNLDQAKLRDGWPVAAQGTLNIDSLVWKLGINPVALGSYQVQLDEESGVIRGVISTLRGPLQAEGEASLKPDRSWVLDMKIKPEANAPREVVNLANSAGRPDSQGWYRIRQQSPVPPAPTP